MSLAVRLMGLRDLLLDSSGLPFDILLLRIVAPPAVPGAWSPLALLFSVTSFSMGIGS